MKPLVRAALDPLQFAYQDAIGVDDAVIYLMDKVHSHLDTAGSAVRIMFFDFSSAFNTLQPVLLGEKLRQMQVHESIISWTMDYLTGRPQFVRMQGCVSDVAMCSTGAPQGTVLAPFLFNIYTSDIRYNSASLESTANKLNKLSTNSLQLWTMPPTLCTVEKQRSTFSGRLRQLRCAKERRVRSFLPTAIRLYSESPYSRNSTDLLLSEL
ncbi:hypothetical protein NFI96_011566, partial [Prochilodus magdalenae]